MAHFVLAVNVVREYLIGAARKQSVLRKGMNLSAVLDG
jgi:hypothetical protein